VSEGSRAFNFFRGMNNDPLGRQPWIMFLKPGARTVHLLSFPFVDFRPFNLNFREKGDGVEITRF